MLISPPMSKSDRLVNKHSNSMHCQWHYNHWKILKISQKKENQFISGKEKTRRKRKIIVNYYLCLIYFIILIEASRFV